MNRFRGSPALVGLAGGLALCTAAPWAEQGTQEGRMTPSIEDGASVKIDYTLTVDGAVVDSSEGRGPLNYTQGRGQIIPGLEKQLSGLHVGETREVTVPPEDGYGVLDPQAFVEVSKDQLPPDLKPEVGAFLRGMSPDGRSFRARIHEIGQDAVTLNLNHPLAGKTLHFNVTVVEVAPAK